MKDSRLKPESADAEFLEWREQIDQLAHDLASPLSFLDEYINNFSVPREGIAMGDVDICDVARRSFEKVRGTLDHLRNFIKESEMQCGYFDFSKVIRGALSEIGPMAKRRNVELRYVGPEHLIGEFDEKKVERVVMNLLVNAVESMGRKGGSITISLTHDDRSVWIEVADDGRGIPLGVQERIFERGYSSGKRGGSGLGLAYCKRTMESHRGSINVYSREGEGSVFSLGFPHCAALKAESAGGRSGCPAIEAVVLSDELIGWERWLEALQIQRGDAGMMIVDRQSYLANNSQGDITLDPIE